MELVTGALPSVLAKLGELLVGEYNLQKEVKGGIMFLQSELESMQAALEDISRTPADQLPNHDKIWARNVRELSYDIEDNIDSFMVRVKGSELAKKQGFKKFIDKALGSLMQPKIRRKIAIDIRDIKSRVIEVHERRRRYEVSHSVDKPVKVDPRALVRYEKVTELVGINEARDEVIKILTEDNEQNKMVSIVGFGGLGKTTLANVVYEKLRSQFDCSAFVSVSQTPYMDKLFQDMFYQIARKNNASVNVIDELREFLQKKRYFVIIDDIWDISYWKLIRCALPDDSDGYRIITTTRILTVAEQIGGAYKMKPLSLHNSRILMYGRIFGKEGGKAKCPDEQLTEVSDRILKKCAGIPLAIITIASLLISKGGNKMEWYDVCNSIGTGLEENNTVENMRKVLSLSFHDMPSHLRTCLLYLSVLPEDYEIDKVRLIWLWIAEGFIQYGKQGKSLFEIGDSYFNELINRSMIQPVYDAYGAWITQCRVHDMVLDFIRSLSREENFVTICNDVNHISTSKKVRRLSLQNGKTYHSTFGASTSMEQVRSVVVFRSDVDLLPALQSFKVLRVLDLKSCNLSQISLKYLGNLLQLRYLGLGYTDIDQLPEEIGNLQFLQTLNVWGNGISCLPSTIVHLGHLMCLNIDTETRAPNGIGSLTSLEELAQLGIHDDSKDIIKELAQLTKLRVLRIFDYTSKYYGSLHKSLVEYLNKLQKVQDLQVVGSSTHEFNLDGWVIGPQHLRRLELFLCWFTMLPAWVNPSLLIDLSMLEICVRGLQQEDLNILGKLPALRSLDLTVDHEDLGIHGIFTVGACLFQCLVHCKLKGFGGPVVFQQGAMPRLTKLVLELPVRETRKIIGGFDLGLENLLSLHDVYVYCIRSEGSSKEEVEEAKTAVRHAAKIHPNHPTLHLSDY